MTAQYRSTVNVVAPITVTGRDNLLSWGQDAFAAMLQKVDAHMIVGASGYRIASVESQVLTMTFTYEAGQDAEATQIIHDAAQAAGVSYDAVSVRSRGRKVA